jgi:ribosomal protein S13
VETLNSDKIIQEYEQHTELISHKTEIMRLTAEIDRLKQILVDNDLEEELANIATVSQEEQICVDGINHLSKLFANGTFTKDDAQMLDILHKNLRLCRGQSTGDDSKKSKAKKASVSELLSIVKNPPSESA